ncbi:hypothetical protein CK218_16560 [Mesorhizobium sp. WSM3879]|nr:hypothetical protein CK218_16560 [Mesorhizobium sp. WSM3879]
MASSATTDLRQLRRHAAQLISTPRIAQEQLEKLVPRPGWRARLWRSDAAHTSQALDVRLKHCNLSRIGLLAVRLVRRVWRSPTLSTAGQHRPARLQACSSWAFYSSRILGVLVAPGAVWGAIYYKREQRD